MAPSSTGKWVSRVAATGGSRTYRGQVPVNWYAALVVLVILGIVSIVFARYEYQHPHTTAAIQPAVGKTEFAGITFDLCGTTLNTLPASTNSAEVGVSTPGQNVLAVSPKTAAQAGNNATLGAFFAHYPGAALSPTRLKIDNEVFTNGETCKSGPDKGKAGDVKVVVFATPLTNSSTDITSNASTYKIPDRSIFSVGFVPKGTSLPRNQTVSDAVLGYSASVVNGTTTTTTLPVASPTTTAPSATTTTTAPTTTTTKG
jgi:hypothetical protein